MTYEKRSNINEAPAHILRVMVERDDLAEKTDKLTAFLETPTFAALDEEDRQLLAAQLGAMGAYVGILDRRLSKAGV